MADTSDDIGCWLTAGALLFGAYWLYNHYEIRSKGTDAPPPVSTPAKPAAPQRPTGLVDITTLKNGSVWRLDAAAVIGPRSARQFWVREDHSNNKKETARQSQALYRVNCDTTAYRTLSVVDYDKDGGVVANLGPKDLNDTDRFPPPDSVIATAISRACDRGFDQKTGN